MIVTVGGSRRWPAGRSPSGVDAATTASTSSVTVAGGAGAGADSDNSNGGTRGVRIGSAGDTDGPRVVINGGASITGRTVDSGRHGQPAERQPVGPAPRPTRSPSPGLRRRLRRRLLATPSYRAQRPAETTDHRRSQGVDIEATQSGSPSSGTSTCWRSRSSSPQEQHACGGTDSFASLVDTFKLALVTAGAAVRHGVRPGSVPSDMDAGAVRAGAQRHVYRPETRWASLRRRRGGARRFDRLGRRRDHPGRLSGGGARAGHRRGRHRARGATASS